MNFRIIVDNRERASGIPAILKRLGCRVWFSQLTVGDYIIAEGIGIERKSIRDFMRSIYDGRLFLQASALASEFEIPIIIVEGKLDDINADERGVNVYFGAIASLMTNLKVNVVNTLNKQQTALLIYRLWSQISKPKKRRLVLKERKTRPKTLEEWQLYVVSSLPHVGEKTAQTLLRKYGTVRNVMNLTLQQFANVPGIGFERAVTIHKILNTPFSQAIKKKLNNLEKNTTKSQ